MIRKRVRRSAGLLAACIACSDPLDPNTVVTVIISPAVAEISAIGDTVRLTAVALGPGGDTLAGKTFAWMSSDGSVVTVDQGLVTATGNGERTVVAESEGRRGEALVKVAQRASEVSLAPSIDTLVSLGDTARFEAVARDALGNVINHQLFEWATSNAEVATVSASGLVTAEANGTATISASAHGVQATAAVIVEQRAEGLGFLVQPSNVLQAQPITPAVRVTVLDARGSVVAHSDAMVTVTLNSPKPGPTLTGAAVRAVNGVAEFAELAVSHGMRGLTLNVNSMGLSTATSAVFDVILSLKDLSAGHVHTCAVAVNHEGYCWGLGASGRLGHGDTTSSGRPKSLTGGLELEAVSSGGAGSCALTLPGSVYCWGDRRSNMPIEGPGGLTLATITESGGHTCGVTSDGDGYCWGFNESGQLGGGTSESSSPQAPVLVAGGHTWRVISAGGAHTCGVTTTGTAYCWGNNPDGQLGNGGSTPVGVPTVVSGGLTYSTITAAGDHTCALTVTGQAYCWGAGGGGQLGNGTYTGSRVPVAATGGLTFSSIEAGGYEGPQGAHTCGLLKDGAAYCWGYVLALEGRSPGGRNTPTAIDGGVRFKLISAGGFHTCAIALSGQGYCWGFNVYGSLGTGKHESSPVPMPIAPPEP